MDPDGLIRSFARDGFVAAGVVIDPTTVRDLLGRLERLVPPPTIPPEVWATRPIVALAPDDPLAAVVAADGRLAGLARLLLGGEVQAFGTTFLRKPPAVGLAATWHQDGAPWAERLAGRPAVTLWLALHPADAGNGGLRVVPGSHALPAQPLRPDPGPPGLFGVGMDPALVDEGGAIDLTVDAGGVVALHPSLVHGSWPNHSGRPRTAAAVRYHRV